MASKGDVEEAPRAMDEDGSKPSGGPDMKAVAVKALAGTTSLLTVSALELDHDIQNHTSRSAAGNVTPLNPRRLA